jgi:hypothetical protein
MNMPLRDPFARKRASINELLNPVIFSLTSFPSAFVLFEWELSQMQHMHISSCVPTTSSKSPSRYRRLDNIPLYSNEGTRPGLARAQTFIPTFRELTRMVTLNQALLAPRSRLRLSIIPYRTRISYDAQNPVNSFFSMLEVRTTPRLTQLPRIPLVWSVAQCIVKLRPSSQMRSVWRSE